MKIGIKIAHKIYNLHPPSPTSSELFIYIWFESSFSNFEWIIYLYIYFACQFVCLFESNKRQNGWTDRDYFLLDLTWPQERLMNDQKLYSDKIRFTLNFENPQNSFMTSANFFLVLFYNVFNWNRRWARSALKV